jgi:hypothetical protein
MKYVQKGPIAIGCFFYSKVVVGLLPTTRACLSGTELCLFAAAAGESGLKSSEIGHSSKKSVAWSQKSG